MNGTKRCPFCSEDVPSDSIKCRYCGEFFDQPRDRFSPPPEDDVYRRPEPPPSNGVAVASLILSITGCLAPVGLILGIIGLVNAKKHPARPGFGMSIAGIVIGSVMILLMGLVVFGMVLGFRAVSNDINTMAALGTILDAQKTHKEKYGSYADFQNLYFKDLISSDLADATTAGNAKDGYYFKCEADYGSFSCTAIPAEPGISGFRSFYIDETGTIRHKVMNSSQEAPADASSPVMHSPQSQQGYPVRRSGG